MSNTDTNLLEVYKLYVTSTEKVTTWRQNANTFFVSLNTIILGLQQLFSSDKNISNILIIIVPIAGVFLSVIWLFLIISFKKLNSAKYQVIHEIESQMESTLGVKPYAKERQILNANSSKFPYFSLTSIERQVPVIFAFLHLFTLTYYTYKIVTNLSIF
ncbi:MAG: hypothetical protein F6J96_02030 [Symploca sp. SIO1C2]|nr:hypothetical protein [Symploca sp. SIO1C2]